jgi:hypothetical protein
MTDREQSCGALREIIDRAKAEARWADGRGDHEAGLSFWALAARGDEQLSLLQVQRKK